MSMVLTEASRTIFEPSLEAEASVMAMLIPIMSEGLSRQMHFPVPSYCVHALCDAQSMKKMFSVSAPYPLSTFVMLSAGLFVETYIMFDLPLALTTLATSFR